MGSLWVSAIGLWGFTGLTLVVEYRSCFIKRKDIDLILYSSSRGNQEVATNERLKGLIF